MDSQINAGSWKVEYFVKKMPTLSKPLLIEGLPGIANVGKIAVDFLVSDLKAKKLCSFFSYKFPHSVFVNEQKLIESPKIELYYKKFKDPKKRDLLLLVGDVQPIDEVSCHTFCEQILGVVMDFGCTEIITTGGIGLSSLPEEPLVYATANDADFLKQFKVKKLGVATEIFGVVGPIIGVSGVLLGVASRHSVKAAALLAETFSHQMYLGVKGAAAIVKVLDLKYKIGVKVEKINREIIDLEKEMMAKTQEWLKEMQTGGSEAGAKLKDPGHSYIG